MTRLDTEKGQVRALALISGGLDSTLAAAVVARQGIDIHGVHFSIGFESTSFQLQTLALGENHEIEITLIDTAEEFIHDVLIDPRHGRGQHMNPCIDCHLFMLRKAGELLDELEAEFIITGEVVGQRPMSQHIQALDLIAEESGLKGLLLRPLSARCLEPTTAEKNGWVDRELLFGIRGRSRKAQIALAAEYGIMEYPQPAGGCLLTSPGYSRRLEDLIEHTPDRGVLSPEDMILLRFGRHFRLPSGIKVIVGRDDGENRTLRELSSDMWLIEVAGHGSPLTLVERKASREDLQIAAELTARYSQGRDAAVVLAGISRGEESEEIKIKPLARDEGEAWMIR